MPRLPTRFATRDTSLAKKRLNSSGLLVRAATIRRACWPRLDRGELHVVHQRSGVACPCDARLSVLAITDSEALMHAGGIEIAQWKECESARQCEALETLVEVS